jgi:starch synthase (maltosyl-transferring)
MRRVFYLITELDVGGAEKALFELATRLDRRRFEPTVACLTGRGALFGRLREKGIEVIPIDMRGWWDLGAWLRLRAALRANRPHVLHTFLFHANFAGRLAAVGLGIGRKIASIRVEEPRLRHLWLEGLTQG